MIRPAIDPDEISDADYDVGCRIIAKKIKKFFEDPEVRKKYKEV